MQSLWRDIDSESILGGAVQQAEMRLAVRARGAGAGQDQVVDELALSNLSNGGSIDEFFFARRGTRGRLFLLYLQFMFDGAGGVGGEGHRDEQTRGRHRCCTLFVLRLRAGRGRRYAP